MQYVHWKELGIDQIRAFSSAITALDEGVCWKPDIILSDIRMPGMDGIELCRKFHEVLPDSDIIFVTAYASIEYMREAFRMRAVEFLKIFLKILWSHNRILRIMLYIMLMSASV
jgi:two-component system response regulator YesN